MMTRIRLVGQLADSVSMHGTDLGPVNLPDGPLSFTKGDQYDDDESLKNYPPPPHFIFRSMTEVSILRYSVPILFIKPISYQ